MIQLVLIVNRGRVVPITVLFLPCQSSVCTAFLITVAEVKVSELPHVFTDCGWGNQGVLLVDDIPATNPFLC